MLPYVYRVTKYDPADRDEHGCYAGAEDTISDHGQVEAAYLQAVEAFAVNTGIDHLAVREPQVSSLVHFGVEQPLEGFGLEGLFPTGLSGFHEGAEVPLDRILTAGIRLPRAGISHRSSWWLTRCGGCLVPCSPGPAALPEESEAPRHVPARTEPRRLHRRPTRPGKRERGGRYDGRNVISTRRFCLRPASVELSAIG